MELSEQVRMLKLTKQDLQEDCQKQQIDCEKRTADEMKARLLSCDKVHSMSPSQVFSHLRIFLKQRHKLDDHKINKELH
ncbi:UNVERIFIED_CONTAM: hypothetical protein K2H54_044145 [Gekko kuhli]